MCTPREIKGSFKGPAERPSPRFCLCRHLVSRETSPQLGPCRWPPPLAYAADPPSPLPMQAPGFQVPSRSPQLWTLPLASPPLPAQALVSRETSPTDGAVVTVSRCGSDCCAWWGMALVWN